MKSQFLSTKHTSYFDVYDSLFSKFLQQRITFVEVGVLNGGSLFMWRNYFGSKARIIGIDSNPGAEKWLEYGYEIYVGDQANPVFWEETLEKIGPIHVLLDDGGHTYIQQIVTVEKVLSKIVDGGLVVVEDVHTSYLRGYGSHRFTFIDYVHGYIDRINFRSAVIGKEEKADNRVSKIEIYDSIVAFHVNRSMSQSISKPIANHGKNDFARDFRNVELHALLKWEKVSKLLGLYKFPILRRLVYEIRVFLANSNSRYRATKKFLNNRNVKN